MQLLQHEHVDIFFCQQCAGNPPANETFPVSSFTANKVCAMSTKHARANMGEYWDGGEI